MAMADLDLHILTLTSHHPTSNPSLLAADLTHYRDLFSKLRFSYVESVTKERFLRALTSSPPEFASHGDNAALEEELKIAKAGLKEKKVEVEGLIGELEKESRTLVARWDGVREARVRLQDLPAEIDGLRERIEELQAAQPSASDDPQLAMPLQPTQELLAEREAQLAAIDREIESLERAVPAKKAALARLQEELQPLQVRKMGAVQAVKEAKRARGQNGEDEVMGRWLRGVEGGLRGMLEV